MAQDGDPGSGDAAARERLLGLLERTEPFRGLPPDATEELLRAFHFRAEPAGTVICREGDPGDELFLIEEGELDTSATFAGVEARLGSMGAGDLFGEIAVLRRGPRTATVTARTDVGLWVLSRQALLTVARRAPALGKAIQEIMRRRELRSRLRAMQ
jgi:CRP-like cAMP-binding protein